MAWQFNKQRYVKFQKKQGQTAHRSEVIGKQGKRQTKKTETRTDSKKKESWQDDKKINIIKK